MADNIGLSHNPVDQETDPGFGADTEQRRVEFAAKLEEETYMQAIDDVTKIARINLIKALQLWKLSRLYSVAQKLTLRDIMIVWRVFEILFLLTVYNNCLSNQQKIELLRAKNLFESFFITILSSLQTDIKNKVGLLALNRECINKTRQTFGGDLIFSLKNKTHESIIDIYNKTSSRIAPSQREMFISNLQGIALPTEDIFGALKEKNSYQKLCIEIAERIKLHHEYLQNDSEQLSLLIEMITGIHPQSGTKIKDSILGSKSLSDEEVKNRVKKYYGIDN